MTVVWLSVGDQISNRAGSAWLGYIIHEIQLWAMEEPLAPPQKIYVLNLLEVNHKEAALSTIEGTVVRAPVFWTAHEARPYGGTVDREGNSFSVEKEFLLFSQDPEWIMHDGTAMTMKHLGIVARRGLGLPGRTSLGVSVRVLSGTKVLGIHQPLATLMDAQSCEYSWANQHCHCCQQGLLGPTLEYSWANPHCVEPFAHCYFCGDSPSWHHGWCCPHNPQSDFYRGRSHTSRYHQHVMRARTDNNLRT